MIVLFLLIDRGSVARCISHFKSLKHLRIEAIGSINMPTIMIFHFNELPELISYECISPGYRTDVLFMSSIRTNIENLTIACIFIGLGNILQRTPKLKYLNITVTSNRQQLSPMISFPLPVMNNLTHLKVKIRSLSYNHLLMLMKAMPHLEDLKLSGSSFGPNLDNGHHLKQLFGHMQDVQFTDFDSETAATLLDTILATFHDEIDRFWSHVECSIRNNRVYLSAFGQAS